jgi:O-antigen ligase
MNLFKKIIEYGLYILVFILPWQTRWIIRAGELNGGYWEYGTYSIYATDILLMVVFVIFIFVKLLESSLNNSNSEIAPREPHVASFLRMTVPLYWWLIAGLELFILVSIFFAPNKSLALFNYIRWLLGIGLFWLIIKANYNKFKLTICLISGVFLQAVLGIWQFLAQSSFASKWLGMALHNSADLGTSVVETLSGERWLRAYGGLDHPNILGGLLVVGILMTIYLILNNQQLNFELKIKKFKLLFFSSYFLLLAFIAALFFTFSRGAWIGAGAGILIIFILAVIKNDWLAQKKLLKIILLSGIFIFIASSIFSDLVSARTSSALRLENKSNSERIESYRTSLKIIKNHWLFGTGIGNYTLAVHNEIDKTQPSYFYQPAHNIYLLILSEIGILGFIFFISLLLYVLIFNFEIRILLEYSNIALIVSLFVMMSIDHWFWSLHFGVLLFWLVLGLAVTRSKN